MNNLEKGFKESTGIISLFILFYIDYLITKKILSISQYIINYHELTGYIYSIDLQLFSLLLIIKSFFIILIAMITGSYLKSGKI